MGLFEKKDCAICGRKTGILKTKFLGGVLCSQCYGNYIPEILHERDNNVDDKFKYKKLTLEELRECHEHFANENVLKKHTKGLPTCLGAFAYDTEKQIIEIKGKKGVWRVKADMIDSVIFSCVNAENTNKMKINFILSSHTVPWLEGYLFSGVFKNDAFFKKTALKQAREEIKAMSDEMNIEFMEA